MFEIWGGGAPSMGIVRENSEVLPSGSVAVAETVRGPAGQGQVTSNEAMPLTLVTMVAAPRKTLPSPKPDGPAFVSPKNSMR